MHLSGVVLCFIPWCAFSFTCDDDIFSSAGNHLAPPLHIPRVELSWAMLRANCIYKIHTSWPAKKSKNTAWIPQGLVLCTSTSCFFSPGPLVGDSPHDTPGLTMTVGTSSSWSHVGQIDYKNWFLLGQKQFLTIFFCLDWDILRQTRLIFLDSPSSNLRFLGIHENQHWIPALSQDFRTNSHTTWICFKIFKRPSKQRQLYGNWKLLTITYTIRNYISSYLILSSFPRFWWIN